MRRVRLTATFVYKQQAKHLSTGRLRRLAGHAHLGVRDTPVNLIDISRPGIGRSLQATAEAIVAVIIIGRLACLSRLSGACGNL